MCSGMYAPLYKRSGLYRRFTILLVIAKIEKRITTITKLLVIVWSACSYYLCMYSKAKVLMATVNFYALPQLLQAVAILLYLFVFQSFDGRGICRKKMTVAVS